MSGARGRAEPGVQVIPGPGSVLGSVQLITSNVSTIISIIYVVLDLHEVTCVQIWVLSKARPIYLRETITPKKTYTNAH